MHSSQTQTTVIPLSPDSTNLHYSAYKPFKKLLPGSKASPTAGYIFHSSYPCSTGVLWFLGFTLKQLLLHFSSLLRLPTQDLLQVIFRLLPQSFRFILHDMYSHLCLRNENLEFFPSPPPPPLPLGSCSSLPLPCLPPTETPTTTTTWLQAKWRFCSQKKAQSNCLELVQFCTVRPWTHHSLLVLYFTWTLSLGNN